MGLASVVLVCVCVVRVVCVCVCVVVQGAVRSQKPRDNFFLYFVTSSMTPNEEYMQNFKSVDLLVWTLQDFKVPIS